MDKFVIGLDFGTDSVRALLVNALTGEEVRSAVHGYRRWSEQLYCNPSESQYRQHPLDYVESMTAATRELLAGLPHETVKNIVAISIDTTASTIVAVDQSGTPLSLLPEFSEDPDAMFVIWKDHTAKAEADEINKISREWTHDFTRYSGGIYSPEWFWSKILHVTRGNDRIRRNAFSWVEHCDWMPALLTGVTDVRNIKRSRCAAGHKAMWHSDFNGFPSAEFLGTLDEGLAHIASRLPSETYTSDIVFGVLSDEWTARFGLPPDVKVGVGGIDAHFGAVGAFIEPYRLVKVIGTSTCDMLVVPNEKHGRQVVRGICGQVDGSIIPGTLGLEAGQSAFGDLYAWFQRVLSFPLTLLSPGAENVQNVVDRMLYVLSDQAAELPVRENDPVALDWINGRRTPDADFDRTAGIVGLRLDTSAAEIFKSLVEATAFGSRAITDHFRKEGIVVQDVIALGGIAKKSPYVMQTLTNVLNMPIRVVKSEQACALGAAMFAATVANIYGSVEEAQNAMTSGFEATYLPNKDKAAVYDALYKRYKAFANVKL